MHRVLRSAPALTALLAFATSTSALEKTSARLVNEDGHREWDSGSNLSISYFNICTGWIWIWSGWGPGEKIGVAFDPPSATSCQLSTHWQAGSWPVPSGYGFTGTLEVFDADPTDCPTGGALSTQPWLPMSGWNLFFLGTVVTGRFAIVTTTGPGDYPPNPLGLVTDRPAGGPTGPQACGTCYPSTRVSRSYYFGTDTTPLCPGVPLNDGVCDAELLWDVQLSCTVSAEDTTWGSIKSLYR